MVGYFDKPIDSYSEDDTPQFEKVESHINEKMIALIRESCNLREMIEHDELLVKCAMAESKKLTTDAEFNMLKIKYDDLQFDLTKTKEDLLSLYRKRDRPLEEGQLRDEGHTEIQVALARKFNLKKLEWLTESPFNDYGWRGYADFTVSDDATLAIYEIKTRITSIGHLLRQLHLAKQCFAKSYPQFKGKMIQLYAVCLDSNHNRLVLQKDGILLKDCIILLYKTGQFTYWNDKTLENGVEKTNGKN